jgi:hypothetical protein
MMAGAGAGTVQLLAMSIAQTAPKKEHESLGLTLIVMTQFLGG